MVSAPARVLVLGLGNDLLGDDAVGLHVARAVRTQLGDVPNFAVSETNESGLALLDQIAGFAHLVLTDAIATGLASPGQLHEFDESSLGSRRIAGPHFAGVGEMLALGRTMGLPMPASTVIVAVEIADGCAIGAPLSPAVAAAVPLAADRVADHVRRWLRAHSGPV